MAKAVVRLQSLRGGKGGLAILDEGGAWRDISVPWHPSPESVLEEYEGARKSAEKKGELKLPPVKVKTYEDVDREHIGVGAKFPCLDLVETKMAQAAINVHKLNGQPLPGAEVLYAELEMQS